MSVAAKITWKCRIFGHKFKYEDHSLRTYLSDFCLRCGMRPQQVDGQHEREEDAE